MSGIRDFFEMNPFDEKAYRDYLKKNKTERYVMSYLLLQGNKIIRTRPNEKGKIFRKLSDLSYPPKECARTDRASLKGKPMFYGSVFTHKLDRVTLSRGASMIEASEFFRDISTEGRQLLTQSIWINHRNLKLALVPVSSNYQLPCDELKQMQKETRTLAPQLGIENSEDVKFLGDLFAKEKEHNTYNITANFVDYLLNDSEYKDYFDGVIYPSVPNQGEGMNICIRTELIDDGVVQCVGACTEILTKDHKQAKLVQILNCDVLPDGTLGWYNSKELNVAIANPVLFHELFDL